MIGRIRLLIDSMQTMNIIRAGGVPWGTKWANIWVVLFNHPNSIIVIQIGRANERVIIICLVDVKICGRRPKELFIEISQNREIRRKVIPGFFEFDSRIESSLLRMLNILIIRI